MRIYSMTRLLPYSCAISCINASAVSLLLLGQVRAGVGGGEATLFAHDVIRMYQVCAAGHIHDIWGWLGGFVEAYQRLFTYFHGVWMLGSGWGTGIKFSAARNQCLRVCLSVFA